MTSRHTELCMQHLSTKPITVADIAEMHPSPTLAASDYHSCLRKAMIKLEKDGISERVGYTNTGAVLWRLKTADTIYIDLRATSLPLGEIMSKVQELIAEHPDEEIIMDGDAFAIIGRKKEGTA